MKTMRTVLASPRLTLAGFALLALMVWATSADARVSSSWIALPSAVLAANLGATMVVHRALRRGGLGLFHAALLVGMLVVALGRMLHFEGRVEVTQGGELAAEAIEPLSIGPWNNHAWRGVRFEQGPIRVHYAAGVRRAQTVSEVLVPTDGAAPAAQQVGDTTPLVIDGYRFYTTHNKGYAPLLSWQAPERDTTAGAVHLPSYPLFDWKQEQHWRTPDGVDVKLWLRPDAPLNEREAWVFEPAAQAATLVVELQGQRFELRPGDEARVAAGRLRYERLLGWMGYRIHHDPMLLPLFWLALLGIAGLAWHLWPRWVTPRWRRLEWSRPMKGST
jgi:cytochrome c biogenesis protein